MFVPFSASSWARLSGEKILMVWSMPDTARRGSYGWPRDGIVKEIVSLCLR